MSEYQYYEFVAIDRPLTRDQMAELRSRSSRATITPTSFVNEYNWGDLKGDPADWMRRHFDAFVYSANWGHCRLSLRLPHAAVRKADLRKFANDAALHVDDSGTHWIVSWELEEGQDYDRFGMGDGPGWMGRLMALRDELLRGDLRPLYLGWLAGVSAGEVDDDALEPETPPGLAKLTAAQQALVEFLDIDPDLVSAAASGSPNAADDGDDGQIDAWLTTLPATEVHALLKLILQDQAAKAERQIKLAYSAWRKKNAPGKASLAAARAVSDLRTLAVKAEKRRLKKEADQDARLEAERIQQRETYLKTLASNAEQCWLKIDADAERGTAGGYDAATRAIADLGEASALTSTQRKFDHAFKKFMDRHGMRKALVRRLAKAGLCDKAK